MQIGERIRALREAKNLSQGDIETRTASSVVTSLESRTVTPFHFLKRSRNSRAPWRFRVSVFL